VGGMSRTPVMEVDAAVLERLEAYAAEFAREFGRIERTHWAGVYVQGLLLDGERKSIEPLSRRVVVPGWHGDTEQALQQLVNQSPWEQVRVLHRYRALLAETLADPAAVLIIDDTGFAKKGTHSVGVARQYSGTLGKQDNCQIAVSLHYAAPRGDYPLGLRLYLPEEWTDDPARLDKAQVPPGERSFKPKWRIALELLDEVRAEELPHQIVVADAGYGQVTEFRQELDQRGEHYLVGLTGEEIVFTQPPIWEVRPRPPRGRPTSHWWVATTSPRPVAVHVLAEQLARTPVTWRQGSKGPLQAEFAWVRVWPAHRWEQGRLAAEPPAVEAEARWLLVEWRSDGTIKYALSNLPPETRLEPAVALWKSRWQVEQGYQQLKDELGLDHFEGRSWPGFHHHATLTFLAYGFLALERARGTPTPLDPEPEPVLSPPPRRRRHVLVAPAG
jgi:SRSO17 transposase